jgi:hypothetical protein
MIGKLTRATVLLLIATGSAIAAQSEPPCRGNSQVVETCFNLQGRLFVSNGTPSVRILMTGTRRVLGVFDIPKNNSESLPADVENLFNEAPFETIVSGNFEVCPLVKFHEGAMQLVCVERASQLTARRIGQAPTK